jgi:cis-3-alkyl-4-acyloxetan-2-one decarboxylase
VHPEYQFSSQYIEVGEHRLHYIDEGSGSVIVMVHGNPTWSFFYRKLIQLLSKQHRVIAVDNIGCGLSDKPQNYEYTLENHIDNLTSILMHLEIDKCSLILHDWGGAIGMGYAAKKTDSIEKIALLNTAAFRSKNIPLRIALCRIPVLGEFLVRGLNGFAYAATYMAVVKPMDKLTRHYYLLPYNSWKNRIATHRFVKDIPLHRNHPSYDKLVEVEEGLSKLRQLNIPMLILWGGRDFCFTKIFYDEWKQRFPDAEAHFFEECGHYLLEDCFDRSAQFLEDFFQNS